MGVPLLDQEASEYHEIAILGHLLLQDIRHGNQNGIDWWVIGLFRFQGWIWKCSG